MLTKDYTKDPVCLERLINEINASTISIALDLTNISVFGTTVTITFKTDLSNDEWTTCDNIVSAHTGESLEDNYVQPVKNLPFANKKLEDDKSLFRRKHGMSISLTSLATTNATFTIPYNHCKMNEIEAIGATTGDYVNIKVLDSTDGDYSGTPNAVLNQFGFNVYLSPNHYKDKCNYDADLYLGMQLKIEYTNSQDNTRTVYTNFGLHEVA